jgi:hypothetical protein
MTDTTGKTTEADYYFEALCDEGKEISRLKSEIERLTSERDAARHSNELLTLAVRTTEKSLHEEIARGIAARNRAIEECADVVARSVFPLPPDEEIKRDGGGIACMKAAAMARDAIEDQVRSLMNGGDTK